MFVLQPIYWSLISHPPAPSPQSHSTRHGGQMMSMAVAFQQSVTMSYPAILCKISDRQELELLTWEQHELQDWQIGSTDGQLFLFAFVYSYYLWQIILFTWIKRSDVYEFMQAYVYINNHLYVICLWSMTEQYIVLLLCNTVLYNEK